MLNAENFKDDSEIKRCFISITTTKEVAEYIRIASTRSNTSLSNTIRTLLPKTEKEVNRFLDMPEVDIDSGLSDHITTLLTERQYKVLKKEYAKHKKFKSFNMFFNRLMTTKIDYLNRLAVSKESNLKRFAFWVPKIQSEKLTVACDFYNSKYKTNYSKSKFMILAANGIINTSYVVRNVKNTEGNSMIFLYFSKSDLEVFKSRYGAEPNAKLLRDILNSIV